MTLVLPMGLALVAFVLLFVSAGYGISGRALGPIIDDRNRMSLTLAQLVMWSLILLSGLLVLGLYNYGFGGLLIAQLEQQAAAAARPTELRTRRSLRLTPTTCFPRSRTISITSPASRWRRRSCHG